MEDTSRDSVSLHGHSSNHQELTLRSAGGGLRTVSELVAEVKDSKKLVIVDGSPGSGKSTLLHTIKRALAHSILIDLADSKWHGSETGFKESILAYKRGLTDESPVVLFDSLDKFVSECKWDLKAFSAFVRTGVLKGGTLVVATRPAGVNHLYCNFEVGGHYFIDGFSPQSVQSYFKSSTRPEESEQISELLKHHGILMSLCKSPLICCELVKSLRAKKFHTSTLTGIIHDVIMSLIKRELYKTNSDSTQAPDLLSLSEEHSKHFRIMCSLAFQDLVHSTNLDSLESYSMFLSSFSVNNSMASLDELLTFGLMQYCDYDSLYANITKKLYWFLFPEIRDFLAAFTLHLFAPLDQLFFLSEHARHLTRSGNSACLQCFCGLIAQREAEDKLNPTHMMLLSLFELLAYSLDLEDSMQLATFIKCIAETGETSLWKRLAAKNYKLFDMSLLAEHVEAIQPALVELVNCSGIKDWVIEMSPKHREIGRNLKAYITTENVELREDEFLEEMIRLKPCEAIMEGRYRASSDSSEEASITEQKRLKISSFYCKAIREILQRMLQLYSRLKLRGDSRNPAYVSFLSCDCFRKAVQYQMSLEPILPMHFLTVENASRKSGRKESDPYARHFRESHEDKAVELVILLRPCLRKVKFILPSGEEAHEIKLSGDFMPDMAYERFMPSLLEELEEIVQCCSSHELFPAKTETVIPVIPVGAKFSVSTVSPPISLPPANKKLSLGASHIENQTRPSTGSSVTVVEETEDHVLLSASGHPHQTSSRQEPSLRTQGQTSHTSLLQPFSSMGTMVQPVQQSRSLSLTKAGTVIYSAEPVKIPVNRVLPLPDENVLIQRGGNGKIFSGTMQGLSVAIKKTLFRSKEFSVAKKVKHKNVITLLAFIWGEENPGHQRRFFCYHVMPKMTGDLARMVTDNKELLLNNLHRAHQNNSQVTETLCANSRHILSSVLQGLAYLHSLHIAHRDVKASNVLIKSQCPCENLLLCSCDAKCELALCDFDAAVELDAQDQLPPVLFSSNQTLQSLAPQFHCIAVGTDGFRAPECSMHITANSASAFSPPISSRCDIFSFGVLCLRLMVGEEGPYRQKVQAMLLLHYHETVGHVEGRWGKRPLTVSKVMTEDLLKLFVLRREMGWFRDSSDFVECCLKINPLERLTANQLLMHKFFQSQSYHHYSSLN